MKAIQVNEFGGPEVMKLETLPDPEPGPGQVLVGIAAAGVNPVDTYIRSGQYASKPSLPFTPGSDAAGTVLAVGEGVRSVKSGDRVYLQGSITGTYAERALCLESQVHPLPASVTFSQGAAIGVPYATAYRALFQRGHALPGEPVLVHGATGGVGIAATQLAAAAGLVVYGTGGSERGRQLVREQGAHQVLDHHSADYLEQIKTLTGGKGIALILEMLANENLGKDLEILAPGGRVVVIGSRGKVEIDPRMTMAKESAIFGLVLNNASPAETFSIHAALVAGLANGTLRPVVGEEIPLAEAPRAHQAVMAGQSYGKVVLVL